MKFNKKLFNGEINSPADLREIYQRLRENQILSSESYPEQFDVSFDFAPRMCDRGNEHLCPFKASPILPQYCHGYSGKGKLCPITKILADYKSDCFPERCPIVSSELIDICLGCSTPIEA